MTGPSPDTTLGKMGAFAVAITLVVAAVLRLELGGRWNGLVCVYVTRSDPICLKKN